MKQPNKEDIAAYLLWWISVNREAMRDENDECIADLFINYIMYTRILNITR
jgi:hypothetical protein